jgi:predicted dehydrogenase
VTTVRAGLIGLGMMGRHHARVLRSLDDVELVATADPRGDQHLAVSGVPVLSDVSQVIAEGVDMCVVATPTHSHVETCLALAEAGVHTLVEKPLAASADDARLVTDAFDRAGLVGCVGHIERYNPALQALKARLERNELGDVYQITTRRQGPYPTRIADVGVVMDLATHDVDLTAWVCGADYRTLSAQVAHRSGRQHEDLVAVAGSLTDGTVVNHLVNWLSPMKERVTVVTGERGCFVADTMRADLTFHANGIVPVEWDAFATFRGVVEGDVVKYAIPKPEPLVVELTAFRDAVLGKSHDVVPMSSAVQTVTVAEAILASARTGATVAVGSGATAAVAVGSVG